MISHPSEGASALSAMLVALNTIAVPSEHPAITLSYPQTRSRLSNASLIRVYDISEWSIRFYVVSRVNDGFIAK